MALNFDVPSWLQPPSQGQREQLALAEEEVKQKGVSMLRKQVGMAKMKSDAQRFTSSGMDEGTARKMALLENADLIFVDEPGALVNLIRSDEANAIRSRAQELLAEHRDRTHARLLEKDAEIDAWHQRSNDLREKGILSNADAKAAQAERDFLKLENDTLKAKHQIAYQEEDLKLKRAEQRRKTLEMVGKDTRYEMAAAKVDAAQTQLAKIQKGNWRGIVDPLKVAAAQARVQEAKKELDEITASLMGEQESKAGAGLTTEGKGDTFIQSDSPPARRETSEPARDQQDPLGIRSLLRK